MKLTKRLVALLLVAVMVLGLAVTANAAAGHSDWNSVTYKEAVEVLTFVGAFEADGAFRPNDALTVGELNVIADKFGMTASVSTNAPITGAMFLDMVMGKLALSGTYATYVRDNYLRLGMEAFVDSEPITRQEAAQILMNAMKVKVGGNGAYLGAAVGVVHVADTNYNDGFNRPGSYWTDANGTKVTGTYPATPVLVHGGPISWCNLLQAIGYGADGSPNNDMKWFCNSENGNAFTSRFEKCHWDNNGQSHGGCGNDWTNSNGMTLEVYEVGDKEYRNILITNFLVKVENGGMTFYGWRGNTWGPWEMAGLPANGYYIANYYWNAYGRGEGPVVKQQAKIVNGKLVGMDAGQNWVFFYNENLTSSNWYENSCAFNLGYDDTVGDNSGGNMQAGKRYTFFLDQYGYCVGAIDETALSSSCTHNWHYSPLGSDRHGHTTKHIRQCGTCYGVETLDCNMQEVKTVTADCTQGGYTLKRCHDCGREAIENVTAIDSANHAGGTHFEDAVEATPNSIGHTGTEVCNGCGTVVRISEVIEPHTHEAGTDVLFDDGGHWNPCTAEANCNHKMNSAAHTLSDAVVETEAKPGLPGTKLQTCGCGYELRTSYDWVFDPSDAYIIPIVGDVPFADVQFSDWHYEYVLYMYSNGYMDGTSGWYFEPDEALTRKELVDILWKMEGEPVVASAHTFADVNSPAIAWAVEAGIITGYGDNTFRAQLPIPREQVATILYRYTDSLGKDVSPSADLGRFADAASVSGYALDAMKWAVAEGIINGTGNGSLLPQGNITRAQIAAVLTRYDQ